MELDLPIPNEFEHLHPQTIEVLRQDNFHMSKNDLYRSLVPAVWTPVGFRHDSIAYAFDNVEQGAATFAGKKGKRDYFYSRVGRNLPPADELRNKLIELELGNHASNLQQNYDAVLTSSGMAAITLLCLEFQGKAKKIIASPRLYGGSYHLIKQTLPKKCGFQKPAMVSDPLDLNQWEDVFKKNRDAGLVFIEDDANPNTIKLPTIEIARLAHRYNLLVAMDTTIGTPYLRKPHVEPVPNHEANTDFTVHSLSKNIGGYSRGLGGAIIGRKEIIERFNDKDKGSGPPTGIAVMDARLAEYFLSGATTLNQRMPVKIENAFHIVDFLKNHPKVNLVYHSGSDLLAFEIDGALEEAARFANALTFIPLVPHLGHIRTMAIHPASTTHSPMPPEDRLKHGITDNLIRISIGMEDPQDIIDDLRQALEK